MAKRTKEQLIKEIEKKKNQLKEMEEKEENVIQKDKESEKEDGLKKYSKALNWKYGYGNIFKLKDSKHISREYFILKRWSRFNLSNIVEYFILLEIVFSVCLFSLELVYEIFFEPFLYTFGDIILVVACIFPFVCIPLALFWDFATKKRQYFTGSDLDTILKEYKDNHENL